MTEDRIDLMEEFVGLARQEELLAVVDVELVRPDASPVPGLCRVSKPRGRDLRLVYLSVSFMFDVPDDGARGAVDDLIGAIEDPEMRTALPMIEDVVPVPSLSEDTENYVRQVDLIFKERVDPGKPFVSERLLPSLQRHTKLKVGEIMWWADAEMPPPAAPAAPAPSLLDNLKNFLRRRVRPE